MRKPPGGVAVDAVVDDVEPLEPNRAARRHRNGASKHRRSLTRIRDGVKFYEFNTTKQLPHVVKAQRRAANRRARSARARNR